MSSLFFWFVYFTVDADIDGTDQLEKSTFSKSFEAPWKEGIVEIKVN